MESTKKDKKVSKKKSGTVKKKVETEEKTKRHIIKTEYKKASKGRGEVISIVERVNGEAVVNIITDPKIAFHVTKEEFRKDEEGYDARPEMFIPVNKVEKVECRSRDLLETMHEIAGAKRFYRSCKDIGNNAALEAIHGDSCFHGTDINLEDHHIQRYNIHYANIGELDENPILRKAFWDIEVRVKDTPRNMDISQWSKIGQAPIDAVSLFDQHTGRMYVLLLRDEENPLIQEYEDNIEEESELLKDFLNAENERLIKLKKVTKVEVKETIIKFYDDDVSLLNVFFFLINEKLQPDFLLAWNAKFDFNYTVKRLTNSGYDPKDFFCSDEWGENGQAGFDVRKLFYYADDKANKASKKKDRMIVSSKTTYVDFMLQYAALRDVSGEADSLGLDDVLEKEISYNKYERKWSFREFAMKNFRDFVNYSSIDVYGMALLENSLQEVDFVQNIANITGTRYHKAWSKSVCLVNFAILKMPQLGFVCSNNRNAIFRTAKEKFKGAWVADPILNSRNGIEIFGRMSKFIFDNCCDFDLRALYPSIIDAFMIDPANQLGKVIMMVMNEDVAEEWVRDYIAERWVEYCQKYFNLPSIEELHSIIVEADLA